MNTLFKLQHIHIQHTAQRCSHPDIFKYLQKFYAIYNHNDILFLWFSYINFNVILLLKMSSTFIHLLS